MHKTSSLSSLTDAPPLLPLLPQRVVGGSFTGQKM